jgi:fructuronate reductase
VSGAASAHEADNPQHRLNATVLAQLPAAILRPRYAIESVGMGVVHLGPGAFHRAHQACYFDDALERDSRWGISAISLKSAALRDALAPQQGLYTLAILDEPIRYRVIGALRETLVASEDNERTLARLSAQHTKIVSLTITEKGYCLGADGQIDFAHADIRADLAAPHAPTSALGFIVEALRRRHAAWIAPFSVISCDNLVDNGGKLGKAVVALAAESDRNLAQWIQSEVAFPRTMVDSIVPATEPALVQHVANALGVEDRWPVQREAFTQWVIENRFCNDVPDWAAIGVSITDDVATFEQAKLRLLNGAHSTLAYLGSLAGHETVVQAMNDGTLAAFVEHLMRADILPSLSATRGLDVEGYIQSVLTRLRNPAMRHALAQIAWDGSAKLPFRLLGTIRDALAAGRPVARLCLPVAAWLHFIVRAQRERRLLVDPMAGTLNAIASGCGASHARDVAEFLSVENVFGQDLPRDARFVAAMEKAYARLATLPIHDAIRL